MGWEYVARFPEDLASRPSAEGWCLRVTPCQRLMSEQAALSQTGLNFCYSISANS